MIAQKKYCEIILNNPQLLGELVKKIGKTMKLQSIELGLKRENASIRKSMAFAELLQGHFLLISVHYNREFYLFLRKF